MRERSAESYQEALNNQNAIVVKINATSIYSRESSGDALRQLTNEVGVG